MANDEPTVDEINFENLNDPEITLIAAFDKNGLLHTVINKQADPCDMVTIVDRDMLAGPQPVDTFNGGEAGPLILAKTEPVEILNYRLPGVGADGSPQQCIVIRGNKIPHPGR